MTLAAGSRLGPYEILSPLGAGGMGEVYRARDTRLKRDVAVKVLPGAYSEDPDRLRRFEQEAQAASALNHPNILSIYDFGTHEGAPYIVSELLEGETLRSHLAGGAFTPRKAIGHGLQIAQGLAAAHEKGIVHRDLKPENLFVTADGRVKILDFGLAKLTQPEGLSASQTNLPTVTPGTEPGVVLGTMGYMSPEQVRGKGTDARSDIFSFGAILYEMLAGRRAFHGDTAADTISAILTKDPPDLSETNHRIPEALDRIVRHCLEKSPESRFHSASDIAFNLDAISGTSMAGVAVAPGRTSPGALLRRALPWLAVLAALAAYLVGRRAAPSGAAVSAGPNVTVRQLTLQPGVESFPSLSPDGSSLAYEAGPPGNTDVFVQRVGGHKAVNLTKDCAMDDGQPAFSPSGDRIAFRSGCSGGGIFLMGATGENIRKLSDFGFYPAWSPDEKQIAVSSVSFTDPYSRPGRGDLWAVDVASGARRQVLMKTDCLQPSWSPHGNRIACWGLPPAGGQRDILTVPAAGEKAGPAVAVTSDPATDWNPVWSPDGKYLYFASDGGGSMNFWKIAIDEKSGKPLAAPLSVTLPAGWVGPVSLSRDGRRIAYETRAALPMIERWPFDPAAERVTGPATPIFRGSLPILGFELSPDGQSIVFASGGNRQDLFLLRSDGAGLRQLTDDPQKDRNPGWARDGDRIFFMSDRSGRYDTWSIRSDGSGLSQVTRDAASGLWWPIFSPDGTIFAAADGKTSYLFRPGKTPAEGKLEALALPGEPDVWFAVRDWSPDGKKLAGTYAKGRDGYGVSLYSLDSKSYERLTKSGAYPRFLPDGKRLLYADRSAVWLIDAASKKTHEVIPAGTELDLLHFVVAPDGRSIYTLQALTESDIWEANLDGAAKP